MEPITMTIAGIKFVDITAVKIKLLIFYWKAKSFVAAAGISAQSLTLVAVAAMLTAAIEGKSADKIFQAGLKNGMSEVLSIFITYNVIKA